MNIISGLKRYKILSLVGDGTYGLVYMATNVETREKVAILILLFDPVVEAREEILQIFQLLFWRINDFINSF